MFALIAIVGIAVVISAKVAPVEHNDEMLAQEQRNSPVVNSVIKSIFG